MRFSMVSGVACSSVWGIIRNRIFRVVKVFEEEKIYFYIYILVFFVLIFVRKIMYVIILLIINCLLLILY